MSKRHAFLLMSGGFDSTALACYYLIHDYIVHPVKILYDSRQIEPEQKALNHIIETLNLERLIELKVPLYNPSSLSKSVSPDKVERGAYSDFKSVSTVVPGRNLVFLSMLANVAEAWKMKHPNDEVTISSGVHSSDWVMYPDCRPKFLNAVRDAIMASTDGKVLVEFPFANVSKSEIIGGLLETRPLPAKMIDAFFTSYSCYCGGKVHCGTCPTCIERHEAFIAGLGYDITEYERPFTEKE